MHTHTYTHTHTDHINYVLSFICPHIIMTIKGNTYILSDFTSVIHIHNHVFMQNDHRNIFIRRVFHSNLHKEGTHKIFAE